MVGKRSGHSCGLAGAHSFILREAMEAELIAEVKVNLMSISVLLKMRHVTVSDIYYLLLLFVSTELLFRNLIFRGGKKNPPKWPR